MFLSGLLARFGVFLAMLAILAVPALDRALAIRAVARKRRALGLRRVAGVLFRPGLFYAPGHTWLHRRATAARSSSASTTSPQRLLPSVSAVELPRAGTIVARGETIATLHGGGASCGSARRSRGASRA